MYPDMLKMQLCSYLELELAFTALCSDIVSLNNLKPSYIMRKN